MADVFLSYKRDDAARVRKLVAALRSAALDAWWDEDIPPSAPWEATIERALRDAKAVIVCWSPASVASENVRSEARVAREDGRLIQVFVRPCTPPLFFGERQGVDLSKWRGNADDPRVARIVEVVRKVEAGEQVEGSERPKVQRGVLGLRHYLVIATIVLLVLAAGGVIAWRSALARPAPELAVLPFEDLSPTHDKAFFAEGVAEEIQSSLGAQKGIKLLGRTSASQLERNADPRAIRASLGVTHLLEGSARTAGNDLRVNVRLIDTRDGSELWEEEYHGGLSDVFHVQDQIAKSVVQRLRGSLFSNQIRAAARTSVDAYETYLAARALMKQTTKQSITRAWHMARDLVDAHPDYAPGQALFADATSLLADSPFTYGDIPPETASRIAVAHAREAIRLEPDRADGYAALGLAVPPQEAIALYQKALALDPSLVNVRGRLAIALNELKRNDEAFEQYRIAAEMDPLSQATVNRYIQTLAASGRAVEAMKATELFVRRSGSVAQGWRFRANVYGYLGAESQQIAARRRALQLQPGLPYQHEILARSLHLLGLDEQASADVPHISSYFRMFIADDRGALKSRVAEDGARAWNANGIETAIFSLARARDWPAVVRFYDVRPAGSHDVCLTGPPFLPSLIMGLRQQARAPEAQHLFDCTKQQVSRQLAMHYRDPDDGPGGLEVMQASLLAIAGDKRALDWLDKAVQRGWLGQYYSSKLSDWPQFDAFRTDPRNGAIQARIDAKIAHERAGVLAFM